MTRITVTQARDAMARGLEAGTSPGGLRAAEVFGHGTLILYFYAPRGEDRQPVHEQDEVYLVLKGSGTFALGDSEATLERTAFRPGDAIFVPAGRLHRFEDFTDDFETWVVMYGPEGGEQGSEAPAAA